MLRNVYQFFGKKSAMSAGLNFTRKNGCIEIAPAFNPDRDMRGPIQKGSNIYNYQAKRFFSIAPTEAAQLLKNIAILEQTPKTQINGILHDRGKVSDSQENYLTLLNVGTWSYTNNKQQQITKLTISIGHKPKNQQGAKTDYLSYMFHDHNEIEQFKGYLEFILKNVGPMGIFLEELQYELTKPQDNSKPSYKPNNNQQGGYSGGAPGGFV